MSISVVYDHLIRRQLASRVATEDNQPEAVPLDQHPAHAVNDMIQCQRLRVDAVPEQRSLALCTTFARRQWRLLWWLKTVGQMRFQSDVNAGGSQRAYMATTASMFSASTLYMIQSLERETRWPS